MLDNTSKKTATLATIAGFALAICLTGIRPAGAVDLGPVATGICLGTNLMPGTFVARDGNGNVGVIRASRNNTVEADDDANGLTKTEVVH